MKFVKNPPDWKGKPPILLSALKLPTSWSRFTIERIEPPIPEPVFIVQFQATVKGDNCDDGIFIYGIRYDLSKVRLKGIEFNDGYFLEFLVQEVHFNKSQTHHLLQQNSAVFSDTYEKDDHIPAVKMSKLLGEKRPQWKVEEAVWPTFRGLPMIFVGQITLAETDITRTLLTWNETIFLFWINDEGRSKFKIVTQDAKYQSAEDHHAIEDAGTSNN